MRMSRITLLRHGGSETVCVFDTGATTEMTEFLAALQVVVSRKLAKRDVQRDVATGRNVQMLVKSSGKLVEYVIIDPKGTMHIGCWPSHERSSKDFEVLPGDGVYIHDGYPYIVSAQIIAECPRQEMV